MKNNIRVAITGASGSIGAQLVNQLAEREGIELALALDIIPRVFTSKNVIFHQHDVTQSMDYLLRDYGITTVVHLAFQLRPSRDRWGSYVTNVGGTAQVLKDCVAANIGHLIYLSSTTVYGTNTMDDSHFTEDSLLCPVKGFSYAEDKAATERLLSSHISSGSGFPVTTLRSCIVMGPLSANFITSALSKPALIGIRGCDPAMQFLHEEDLLSVICKFIDSQEAGTYNVAGSESIPYSELARLAGKPLIWLPPGLAYFLTQASWALRLQSDSPSTGLDLIRWPWLANTDKLINSIGSGWLRSSREAVLSSLNPL